MRALTEFLLREALALLLDDPTQRNVAQAMGGAHAQEAPLLAESQTDEATEESESQAPFVSLTSHRVMMVRATNSKQQLLTLVDRGFSIEAFVPQALVDELCATKRYNSLSRLRGSVVRVEKYHFATPALCLETQRSGQKTTSVSARLAQRRQTKLWLFVSALSVIDDSELAVNPTPFLEEHDAIAKQLNALSASALETRLARRQELAIEPTAMPSPSELDTAYTLLLDGAELRKEQESDVVAQAWYPEDAQVGPTDSQLIVENGPVSRTDSLPTSSGNTIVSSSGNTVVSSSDTASPAQGPRIIVLETEPKLLSQSQPEVDASVPDSQVARFQAENLQKAFIECSDTDSDDAGYEEADDSAALQPGQSMPQSDVEKGSDNLPEATSLSSTESESTQAVGEQSQQLLTQAQRLSASLLLEESTQASQTSEVRGEFVGVVRTDHDEPFTQASDGSQGGNLHASRNSVEKTQWNTEAQDPSQPPEEEPSETETLDMEYEVPEEEEATGSNSADEERERATMSQQDGQPDHWMDSQPRGSSPEKVPTPKKRSRSLPTESPLTEVRNVTQRTKRRRSEAASADSPRAPSHEPRINAVRLNPAPQETSSNRSNARAAAPDPDIFVSFMASGSSSSPSTSAFSQSLGISSFNKRASDPQLRKLRPSKRYEHLLPPFDLNSISRLIANKNS